MVTFKNLCSGFDPDAPWDKNTLTYDQVQWVARVSGFWHQVKIGAARECWPWTGYKRRSGNTQIFYGQYRMGGYCGNVHRIAYYLAVGDFDVDLIVRHKCDFGLCCNPMHLELGTHQDNYDDMVARNRRRYLCGDDHPRCVVSLTDFKNLLFDYFWGVPRPALAKKYGVSVEYVRVMLQGRSWHTRENPGLRIMKPGQID